MINNVNELLNYFDINNFESFSRTREFDESRFARFSFGLCIDGQDVYSDFKSHDVTLANALIINSSRDESDAFDRCERFNFPLDSEFLSEYAKRITRDNLRQTILNRYGECSEIGLDVIEEWLHDDLVHALLTESEFEIKPQSIDECHYQPEYIDDTWIEMWAGSGIAVNDEGVFGIISTYDDCDWNNEYIDLLHESCAIGFKEACNSIIEAWDSSDYIEWCYEQILTKDPLNFFNVPSTERRDYTIHFTKSNNGYSFDKVEIFQPNSETRDLRLETELYGSLSFALAEFDSELKKNPSIRNTGLQTLIFHDDVVEFFDESYPDMKVGESDIAKVNNRSFNIPAKRYKRNLKAAIIKEYLPVKPNLNFNDIVKLIEWERDRQKELAHGGNTDDFDKTLSANDFIALAISYLGRATQKSFRNKREKQDYRQNIIKAVSLLVTSLEFQGTALLNCDINLQNEDK